MKRSAIIALSLLAVGGTAACGSLGDSKTAPALAVLRGDLNPDAQHPAVLQSTSGSVRIAVVWTALEGNGYALAQDLPVQPVFPSSFQISLNAPPPDAAIITKAKIQQRDSTEVSPPSAGPSPTPAPQPPAGGSSVHGQDLGSDDVVGWADDFGVAVGSVVAYEDLNGNGKLDLVPADATAYVDSILGANDNTLLIYLEGTVPLDGHDSLRDESGNAPGLGYSLFHEPRCDVRPTTGGSPAETCTDKSVWMGMDQKYSLDLSNNPAWSQMMCQSSGFQTVSETTSSDGAGPAPAQTTGDGTGNADAGGGVPARSYPAPNDPLLTCATDGRSYTYDCKPTTTVSTPKLCGGGQESVSVSCGSIPMPSPQPANWPCTVN